MLVRAGLAVLGLAAVAAIWAAGCSCCGTSSEAPQPAPAPAAAAPEAAAPAAGEVRMTTPSKDYPLKTCVVSGEDLDEMGEPVAILYEGTEVQFCCKKCIAEFKKDPQKYLAMVKAAK